MKVNYREDGTAYVSRFEPGDLVRLRTDEAGDGAMGKAGHWGSVTSVEGRTAGRLNIQLAGYSEKRQSPLQRLTGIPASIVLPCDAQGETVTLPPKFGPRGLRVIAGTPRGHHVTVSANDDLPPWAASLVVAGSTLLLVVAAVVAIKGFGVM